jgi:hypothetical protein
VTKDAGLYGIALSEVTTSVSGPCLASDAAAKPVTALAGEDVWRVLHRWRRYAAV